MSLFRLRIVRSSVAGMPTNGRTAFESIRKRAQAKLGQIDSPPLTETASQSPGRRALLLDLTGDERAAREWACRMLSGLEVQLINKADLKWRSKIESMRLVRSLAPHTFSVFSPDLNIQSSRGAMMLFAATTGARRIVIGDRAGRILNRSRVTALLIEAPRFILELLFGYGLVVPTSWLLTMLLSGWLALRRTGRAGRATPARQPTEAEGNDGGLKIRPGGSATPRTLLYVRPTPLAISSDGSPGGMVAHVAGFTNGALALGHRLTLLASGGAGAISESIEVKSIRPSPAVSASRALFELWNNLLFTAKAIRVLRERTPQGPPRLDDVDLLYQRYSRFNWTGVALSLITGLPLLLEFNGSEVWVGRHWDPIDQMWLLERFERLNLRSADLIIVVSEVARRNLTASGVERTRILVNPNGVDTDEFRPGCGGADIRRDLGVEGKIIIGFLGSFGPWHGTEVLAQAAALLREEARYSLLFIGEGDARPRTESTLEAAGRRAIAIFTGWVPHAKVAAYLDACDILVSPHLAPPDGSEFFGSPTKLFEYLAMARPVIASRVGQIAEVIRDGQCGLLVEPGDPIALAQAIELLAADQEMARRLGAAGRALASGQYTWRHNARRVIDAFEQLEAAGSIRARG